MSNEKQGRMAQATAESLERTQLGCASHGFKFRDGCDACQTTEPMAERACSHHCGHNVDYLNESGECCFVFAPCDDPSHNFRCGHHCCLSPLEAPQDAPPSAEPPARVWVQLRPMPPSNLVGIVSYHEKPGDDERGNGTPFYEYAHLAPIRAALEACDVRVESDYVTVSKAGWDALVAVIKGETK